MRAGTIAMVAVAGAVATGVVLPTVAWSQLQASGSVSMQRVGGAWRAAVFVCDAIDRDRVMVLSAPDGERRAELTSYTKPGLAARSVRVRLGRADAGMNQLWYPLLDHGGREAGNIHAVNPAMVEPGATTPTVTSLTWRGQSSDCRFAPQTRVLGVTQRRSVQVTRTAAGVYRYRSYDHGANLPAIDQPWGGRDTRASLTIDGGRLVARSDNQRVYQFANDGYLFRVFVALDPARGGGGVQVWQRGRTVLSEPFGAYTAAIQP